MHLALYLSYMCIYFSFACRVYCGFIQLDAVNPLCLYNVVVKVQPETRVELATDNNCFSCFVLEVPNGPVP